jgi:hypothetical protein
MADPRRPNNLTKPGSEAKKHEAATGHRCQAQAHHKEQLRLPILNPRPTPGSCQISHANPSHRRRRVRPVSLLLSHIPWCSSSDFTNQDRPPHVKLTPRSEERPLKATPKPKQISNSYTFRKGTTSKAPPSLIQKMGRVPYVAL